MKNVSVIAAAAGLSLGVSASFGQLVVGNTQTSDQGLWVIDLSGQRPDRRLVSGSNASAAAVAADEANRVLYWASGSTLRRAAYTIAEPLTVETLGTMRLGNTTDTFAVDSFAFDTAAGRLYAYRNATTLEFPQGIYEVDINTQRATLVLPTPGARLAGFDYDPTTDTFYALNNNAGGPGRGIIRIPKPLATSTLQNISPYPAGIFEFYGLSAGGGNLYLVNRNATDPIHVFNLGAGAYAGTVASPVTGTTTINAGGAWAPGLLQGAPGVDLRVRIDSPGRCAVAAGGTVRFTVQVDNEGRDTSAPVTLRVPIPTAPGVSFVGSNPAGTVSGGAVTLNLGPIAGSVAQTVTATFDFTATNPGTRLDITPTATSANTDLNPADNTATGFALFTPVAPANAEFRAVLSSVASAPNSVLPGDPAVRYSGSSPFSRPFVSPNGQWWIMQVTTNAPSTSDSVLLVGNGETVAVGVQEGETVLPTFGAVPVGTFVNSQAINDSGQYVFSGNDTNLTNFNRYIVRWNGSSFDMVTQQSNFIPGSTGIFGGWGPTTGSMNITDTGVTAFYSSLQNQATGETNALFAQNGEQLLAWTNRTSPSNRTATYRTFEATANKTFMMDATGQNWIVSALLNDLAAVDAVVVVNNAVVIQEGSPLNATFSEPVAAINHVSMGGDGTWFAYGTNADGQAWVVRGTGLNFEVLARTGEPIAAGSPRRWTTAGYARGFFLAMGNAAGDYVIGGRTDDPDALADDVIVLNGQGVLARENAPVDANDSGQFDDGLYIRTFAEDRAFVTNDDLWVVTTLRNQAAALCGTNTTIAAHALLRIPLDIEEPGCPADFNNDGTVTTADITAYLSAWFAARSDGTLGAADFNNDGAVTTADITAFLSAWFEARAGGC